jgi:ribose-phosphate pyrophosphokinase
MKQKPVIFPLFGCETLAHAIQKKCFYDLGHSTQHQFPDEETVIKIESNVFERTVVFIASLNLPNTKLLPLLFAAETARSLGAVRIILVAPYLAYMRQDKVFEAGQGITSTYFARLISHYFDGIVTIDPHLHRWHALDEIYDIPTKVLHATENIAAWIDKQIQNPLLIGPDAESMQWVKDIAQKLNVPYLVLEKNRTGDSHVEVSIPRIEQYRDFIPCVCDDIISTGMTMIATVRHLQLLHMSAPICIGVHALFNSETEQNIRLAGAEKIITCNTILHPTNQIDITTIIAKGMVELC